jgi:hypothetical protein
MPDVDLDPKSPEYGTVKLSADADNPRNITIIMPPVDLRDAVLGQVMGGWGVVEGVLGVILAHVLKTDFDAARIVAASGLSTIQIKDLIIALGRLRLPEPLQRKIEALGERVKTVNTKRNRIVHGAWHIEVVNLPVPEGAPMAGLERWARVYTPTDPAVSKKVQDPHNQKERKAFRFTLHQMLKLDAEIEKLVADLSTFNDEVYQLLGQPEAASPPPA